jgi:outer membrane protein assembly factor BamB
MMTETLIQGGYSGPLSPARIAPLQVGGGLAVVDGHAYGVECWPGRLYQVGLDDGRSTEVCRLQTNWPKGLASDGTSLWFLETSGHDNRFGVYCIDPQTGQQKSRFACGDIKISGIAAQPSNEGGRLWVSSLAGDVYELDPARAIRGGRLEDGVIRKFKGYYERLCYRDGYLWGIDNEAKRFCRIRVGMSANTSTQMK